MKKLISTLLCISALFAVFAICGTTASALPASPDYKKYVEKELIPKYGSANTDPITKDLKDIPDSKTKEFPEENRTWAKRKGVAGYQIADMDGNGTDDLIVFLFDEDGKDNSLSIEYFTCDTNGAISSKAKYQIFSKDESFMKDIPIANEYVVAGVLKRYNKNVLLVETYYQTAMVSKEDFRVDFSFYECTKEGKFVKYMSYSGKGGNDFMTFSEIKEDGSYGEDKNPLAEVNNYSYLNSSLENSGMGFLSNNADGLSKAMSTFSIINGFKMDFESTMYAKYLPTYFGTEQEKESFYFYTGYVVGQSFVTATNVTGTYRQEDTKKALENYLKTEVTPKYGSANLGDLNASLSNEKDKKTNKYPETNFTWSNRKGIAGYDCGDLNEDLIPDLAVYAFEKDSKITAFDVMVYSADMNNKITECGSETFCEKEEDKITEHLGYSEICTGGIVFNGTKNKLLFECGRVLYPENTAVNENYIFECDETGSLVKSYYTTNQEEKGYVTVYKREPDGSYSKSKNAEQGSYDTIQEEIFVSAGLPMDPNSTQRETKAFGVGTPVNVPAYAFTDFEKKTFYYITYITEDESSKKYSGKNVAGMFSNDELTEKYESYVKTTLVPKYGMADTDKKEAELEYLGMDEYPEENRTWTARKGILRYEIADMSDGVYDMAVYLFDDKDPIMNRMKIEFYTADIKGHIEKNSEFTIHERIADLIREYPFDYETCVGGIVPDNNRINHIVIEDYCCPYRCVDYRYNYNVFSWDSNSEKFYSEYKLDQAAYQGVNLYKGTPDGDYKTEYNECKGDEKYMDVIRRIFHEINFPEPLCTSEDIGLCLGFDSHDLLPSYFDSSDQEMSFYMATYCDHNSSGAEKMPATNIAGTYVRDHSYI